MSSRHDLALALDVSTRADFFKWVETFKGLPVVLKIGLRLMPKLSESDFAEVKRAGFRIFIDAKLHDIPSQVRGAVETWGERNADFLTLHLSGGPKMLSEAAQAATKSRGLELLGVSVLTSLGESDLALMGFTANPAQQVERLARMAIPAGIRSFVCSVGEAKLIKDLAAREFPAFKVRTVCPGIKLAGGRTQSDQSRSYTVEEAMAAGVDMLVVGRAIFDDPNPRACTEQILRTLG